jgi:hypothetical protein
MGRMYMWKISTMLTAIMAIAGTGCALESLEDGESQLDEAETPDTGEVQANITGYERCSPGNICFFTDFNAGGDMCSWFQFDQDWTSGASICSWSRTRNVKSVANFTSKRMQYYKEPNYVNRVGSTLSGVTGNLAGTYKLGSHRPQ